MQQLKMISIAGALTLGGLLAADEVAVDHAGHLALGMKGGKIYKNTLDQQ